MNCKKKNQMLKRRRMRVRRKIHGTAECPRLNVTRSIKHIAAQLIDDDEGKTLASVSSLCAAAKEKGAAGGNIATATVVGGLIAEQATAKSITKVVFDRGGRRYHGRVKALADAAREGGLTF
ncbi:MAG: 50S ribosomal protein L18 [Planctomycetota bacterium]|jgi:large subunit ribosomal protein L18